MATNTTTSAVTPGSGVRGRHPLYSEFVEDWIQMRDTYRGERIVKEKGVKYLSPTSGMLADGFGNAQSEGFKQYNAYRKRAVFPDVVNDAVEAMLGVMHHKPPTIELPDALEDMRTQATLRHESLDMLLKRINEEQLVTGRLGLLLDLPSDLQTGDVLPYIAMYAAEKLINWDEGRRDGIVVDNLNLVVLDESEYERGTDFEWEWQEKFRILTLGDPNMLSPDSGAGDAVENQPRGQGTYHAGVFRDEMENFNLDAMVEPQIRGNTLDEIPFVFINSKDVVPEPDDPPLIGLSNGALTIYRGEADYRQALFMQGQDTLVVVGSAEEDFRTGTGASIQLPIGGDAKYIGVQSSGLSEMREALQNDRAGAAQKGGQMLDNMSRQVESGEALNIRVAARTATLNQIALAGAFGLEQLLKSAATWIGADPDQVIVQPNLDFVDDQLGGEELVKLLTAKTLGAPLSLRSVHGLMQNKGLTEKDFEEEVAEIGDEAGLELGGPDASDEASPEDGNPAEDDGEEEQV
jgi:hypothetical protein